MEYYKEWVKKKICLQNAEAKSIVIPCTDLPADWTIAQVSVFIDESLEFCESVQPQVCQCDFSTMWWYVRGWHSTLEAK